MLVQTTNEINNQAVGVYLGAANSITPEIEKSVILLGEGLVELGLTLVYGGASIGLMGLLAETVKKCGGQVIGIITKHLIAHEILFHQADEVIIVDSMHERKRLIHEKSSRFIGMPGGLGTLDELFETWCQIKLGILQKQLGFVNIDGYFDRLFCFMNDCKNHGFLTGSNLKIPAIYPNVLTCLEDLKTSQYQKQYIPTLVEV